MDTHPPCITCGRPVGPRAGRECPPCRTYRRNHGVARPFGPVDAGRRTGEANPGWKGDRAGVAARRYRTIRLFPHLGVCALCGNRPAVSRHHWDKDIDHNAPENVAPLCRSCHQVLHVWGYVTPA
jgi:hypothetical protein